MNFYKLGGHLTAHRREMQESNRQVMGALAGRNLTLEHPQAYQGAGPSRSTCPVVQLGVLQPRVENGRPCPPTLDLLGLGKAPEDNKDDPGDSEKTIIDLDPDGDDEDDDVGGSSCTGNNKKGRHVVTGGCIASSWVEEKVSMC
ncbi:hypothetical protein Taro_020324 [Colocasia esculenta]|uniref:Uncharacterized protein n=1 Tax=Colocasia esculenta TaxID=4460 RepID=A0A843UW54_COLES|nr:hypothetical protein [Colocasia esculenta]